MRTPVPGARLGESLGSLGAERLEKPRWAQELPLDPGGASLPTPASLTTMTPRASLEDPHGPPDSGFPSGNGS